MLVNYVYGFYIHKGVLIFPLSDFYKPVSPLKLQLKQVYYMNEKEISKLPAKKINTIASYLISLYGWLPIYKIFICEINFDLKQQVIKNTEPYHDGLFQDDNLVSKKVCGSRKRQARYNYYW